MREIKFRAWNHDEEYMMSQMLLSWDGNRFCNEVDNELTIMQYTGLKDKNGVEIYEGDIVSAHGFGPRGEDWDLVGEVNTYKEVLHFYIHSSRGDVNFEFTSHFNEPCIEVIGNIYENPELLTDITSDK